MIDWIHDYAMNLPEVVDTDSCNKTAYKAGKKSFLFVGIKDDSYNVMVKLYESLEQAEAFAKENPENCTVGTHGWTTLKFPSDEGLEDDVLRAWIEESFRLLAPKSLVTKLEE